jgi:hypothetical protein
MDVRHSGRRVNIKFPLAEPEYDFDCAEILLVQCLVLLKLTPAKELDEILESHVGELTSQLPRSEGALSAAACQKLSVCS